MDQKVIDELVKTRTYIMTDEEPEIAITTSEGKKIEVTGKDAKILGCGMDIVLKAITDDVWNSEVKDSIDLAEDT